MRNRRCSRTLCLGLQYISLLALCWRAQIIIIIIIIWSVSQNITSTHWSKQAEILRVPYLLAPSPLFICPSLSVLPLRLFSPSLPSRFLPPSLRSLPFPFVFRPVSPSFPSLLLRIQLKGLGERCKLPSGSGRCPAARSILVHSEHSCISGQSGHCIITCVLLLWKFIAQEHNKVMKYKWTRNLSYFFTKWKWNWEVEKY